MVLLYSSCGITHKLCNFFMSMYSHEIKDFLLFIITSFGVNSLKYMKHLENNLLHR